MEHGSVADKKISLAAREHIRQLPLMNNAFMNLAVEGNIPCVKEMLRVLLSKPDIVGRYGRRKCFRVLIGQYIWTSTRKTARE